MTLQPTTKAQVTLESIIKDWRDRAKNGEELAKAQRIGPDVTAIYVLNACADQLEAYAAEQRKLLSDWMIAHSFATGHGDTLEDLLKALDWQMAEQREKPEERAWLIERQDKQPVEWLCAWSGGFDWTTDSLKAIRFCRRKDANQIAEIFEDLDVHILEHAWG